MPIPLNEWAFLVVSEDSPHYLPTLTQAFYVIIMAFYITIEEDGKAFEVYCRFFV